MIVFLLAVLVVMTVLCLLLGIALYKHVGMLRSCTNDFSNPSSLRFMLIGMLKTVKKEQNWELLEFMRYELRSALQQVDRMRHDPVSLALRKSKPARDCQPNN